MTSLQQVKEQQRQEWDAAAQGWDKWDDVLQRQTQPVADWLCEAIRVQPGARVLDLACGSGQPALTLARRVQPGGTVTATDLSPSMVAIARSKAASSGLNNVEFVEMDVEDLKFSDSSFDAATCRWGLMFCPDAARAVREIHRVLKPGSRFAGVTWDAPARNPLFTLVQQVLSRFVTMPQPDPKAPGMFRLADRDELRSIVTSAGFREAELESHSLGWSFDTGEQYWQMMTDLAAPIRAIVTSLPESQVKEIKTAVVDATSAFRVGDKIELPAAWNSFVTTK